MTLLQWSDKFPLGVDAVDREHRELIGLSNGLHDEVMAKEGKARVLAFFEQLRISPRRRTSCAAVPMSARATQR